MPAVPSASSITGPDAAMGVVSECALLLARAGDALRVADPSNPLAYRFGRIGVWLEVHQAPPAEDGRTFVPPPPDGLLEQFDTMAASGGWVDLINAADEAAAQFILWLDPLRFISVALTELGHADAKLAFLREVAYMLVRVPELSTLAFNDGRPFADEATRAWIAAEVTPLLGSGGGGGGAAGAGGATKSYADKPLKEARALLAEERLPDALALLAKAAQAAPSPSDRFKVTLGSAQLCIQVQQFLVARAQLEGLEKMAEQHRLIDWDPPLCAELYASLYTTYRAISQFEEPTPEGRARMASVFERLCQLDAGAAVRALAGI